MDLITNKQIKQHEIYDYYKLFELLDGKSFEEAIEFLKEEVKKYQTKLYFTVEHYDYRQELYIKTDVLKTDDEFNKQLKNKETQSLIKRIQNNIEKEQQRLNQLEKELDELNEYYS